MNYEAIYGRAAAARSGLVGATLVSVGSLPALPQAVSPLDTVAAVKAAAAKKKAAADPMLSPGMWVLAGLFVIWLVVAGRKGRR